MNLDPEPILLASFVGKRRFDFDSELFGCAVVFLLEHGQYEFTIGDLAGISCPGEAVICPPCTRFFRRVIESVDLSVIRYALPEGTNIKAGKVRFSDFNRIKQDLAMITRHGIKYSFSDSERHFLRDIWFIADSEREKRLKPIDPLMESARLSISSRLSQRFPMSQIAAEAGLTPASLTRRFYKTFGKTPSEYLTGLRIGLAEHLLCETDLPLAVIAENCGFDNEYYFSTCFKKCVGVPPGVYRKSALV